MKKPPLPIEKLRIYALALSLEEQMYELSRQLPKNRFFPLGNDLRRTAAATAHYIAEAHELRSFKLKTEALHSARRQAETAIKRLNTVQETGLGDCGHLADQFTSLIKQCWGLIRYLQVDRQQWQQRAAAAADELLESRR